MFYRLHSRVYFRGVPDGPLAANGDLGVVLGGEPGTALGPPGGKPGGPPGALGVCMHSKVIHLCLYPLPMPIQAYDDYSLLL